MSSTCTDILFVRQVRNVEWCLCSSYSHVPSTRRAREVDDITRKKAKRMSFHLWRERRKENEREREREKELCVTPVNIRLVHVTSLNQGTERDEMTCLIFAYVSFGPFPLANVYRLSSGKHLTWHQWFRVLILFSIAKTAYHRGERERERKGGRWSRLFSFLFSTLNKNADSIWTKSESPLS